MESLKTIIGGICGFFLLLIFLTYLPRFLLGMMLVGIVLFIIFFSLGILITVWEAKKQRKTRT